MKKSCNMLDLGKSRTYSKVYKLDVLKSLPVPDFNRTKNDQKCHVKIEHITVSKDYEKLCRFPEACSVILYNLYGSCVENFVAGIFKLHTRSITIMLKLTQFF